MREMVERCPICNSQMTERLEEQERVVVLVRECPNGCAPPSASICMKRKRVTTPNCKSAPEVV